MRPGGAKLPGGVKSMLPWKIWELSQEMWFPAFGLLVLLVETIVHVNDLSIEHKIYSTAQK